MPNEMSLSMLRPGLVDDQGETVVGFIRLCAEDMPRETDKQARSFARRLAFGVRMLHPYDYEDFE